MSFTNPIIPGFNPDPSIVHVDNDFFLVTSTFEYFPGVPIYHSRDLIKWTLIGHALTRTSQLQIPTPDPGGGVWATTIRYHQGVFHIVAASFQRYRPQEDDRVWPQGFYDKTTDIRDDSTWSDPVYFDQVGFDQDVSSGPVLSIQMLTRSALLGRRWYRLSLLHISQAPAYARCKSQGLCHPHMHSRPGHRKIHVRAKTDT